MKYIVLVLISILIITGCSNSNNSSSAPSSDDLLTSEAIVLGKQEVEGKKKILLAVDVQNPDLMADLETTATHTIDDIIRADKYDLLWLDVTEISAEELKFDAVRNGTKIRFVTENEHLDTRPPTSIAKEVKITITNSITNDVSGVREAAWNDLSDAEKEEVVGDWKNAEVEEAEQSELPIDKGNGDTRKVEKPYKVRFETNNEVLGPIIVFVNGDTKEIIYRVLRK